MKTRPSTLGTDIRHTDWLIECWLLHVQWQIFHACSGRLDTQRLSTLQTEINKIPEKNRDDIRGWLELATCKKLALKTICEARKKNPTWDVYLNVVAVLLR